MNFDQNQYQIDQNRRNEMMRQADEFRLGNNNRSNSGFVPQLRNQVGQFLTRTGQSLQYEAAPTATSTVTVQSV